MPKIKYTMTVSLEEFGKKAGEYALDEYEYNELTIRQWADKITSGEYQPVRHGRWEDHYVEDRQEGLICTVCKELCECEFDYCPHCGAKMDESERISTEAEEDRIAASGIGQAFNPD